MSYRWNGYVRNMIRDYPRSRQELSDLQSQRLTASYGGTAVRGSGISRPTENSVPCGVLSREVDAVAHALEDADDQERELIRLVYWDGGGRYNLVGASVRMFISERTAKRVHKRFILRVAKIFGLLEV